jgi:hypothetical protein
MSGQIKQQFKKSQQGTSKEWRREWNRQKTCTNNLEMFDIQYPSKP